VDRLNWVPVEGIYELLDGRPAVGSVTFTSSTILTDMAEHRQYFPVPIKVELQNGVLATQLRATDDPDITPTGWLYHVVIDVQGSQKETFDLAVPVDTIGSIWLPSVAPAGVGGVFTPSPTAGDFFAFSLMMGVL
jgi:hypothetical protein